MGFYSKLTFEVSSLNYLRFSVASDVSFDLQLIKKKHVAHPLLAVPVSEVNTGPAKVDV